MSHNMFVGSGKRSGTRGGADQFSWEKVKGDKYKDFYLGHSLHTTAKPTFNNRKPNPLWWTKAQEDSGGGAEVDDAARRRAEIAAIKREEEQLHLEALGLAPRRRKTQETQLDSNEIQELTRRGNTERDAYDAERVAGLGFAPAPQHQTDAALLPTTSRSVSGQGDGGDAERTGQRRPQDGESQDEWEEAPDLVGATKAKHGDKKKDPTTSSSSRKSRRDKEERREEKRRKKEEKRKRKEAKKDKSSGRERSERDRHARTEGSDRSRRRDEAGGNRDANNDNDNDKRRHGDDHGREERSRHRRDSASRSPKRRRHDSPSPPVRRSPKHRSRHDSP